MLGEFGKIMNAMLQDRVKSGCRTADAIRERQTPGEQRHLPFEEPETLLAHQIERLERGRRRDIRVAVPVTTDPRSKGEERRYRDRRVGVQLRDRVLEFPVDARDRVGKRRLEIHETATHLIHYGERDRAEIVGAP